MILFLMIPLVCLFVCIICLSWWCIPFLDIRVHHTHTPFGVYICFMKQFCPLLTVPYRSMMDVVSSSANSNIKKQPKEESTRSNTYSLTKRRKKKDERTSVGRHSFSRPYCVE